MLPVRAIVSVSIAVTAVAVFSAPAPSAPSHERQTFRSGVQLVEVDVIVTDRQGNPVRDLTQDDFEIGRGWRGANRADVFTRRSSAGGFVARAQGERVMSEPDGQTGREGFRADFDLSRVSPGPYVLTLEARSSQTGNRTVRRQIPFTVE